VTAGAEAVVTPLEVEEARLRLKRERCRDTITANRAIAGDQRSRNQRSSNDRA